MSDEEPEATDIVEIGRTVSFVVEGKSVIDDHLRLVFSELSDSDLRRFGKRAAAFARSFERQWLDLFPPKLIAHMRRASAWREIDSMVRSFALVLQAVGFAPDEELSRRHAIRGFNIPG